MNLDISVLDGLVRGVRVRGEIDLATIDSLQQALACLPGGPGPIVIDGSQIDFMDSSGLHLLSRLAGTAGDAPRVVIRNPSRAVLRILGVAFPGGIPGLAFEIEDDGRMASGVGGESWQSSPAV
jgi:anti-anti-sigma factor